MLDSETPKGKTYIEHQDTVRDWLASFGHTVIDVSHGSFPFDLLVAKDGEWVSSFVEVKCREFAGDKVIDLDYIKENGYLITLDKILENAKYSKMFGVPFVIVVKLIRSGELLVWKVTDSSGEVVIPYTTRETSTQKSCNGGVANRINAFLSINDAMYVRKPEER